MVVKGVGGRKGRQSRGSRRAAARGGFAQRLRYISQRSKYTSEPTLQPTFTNCADKTVEGVIAEMSAIAGRRPGITDPVRHLIFSLEPADRNPSREELRRMIDIYREERGLKDALYSATVHTDGNDKRHPVHIHMVYNRVRPDGSLVPDNPLDMWINRATSRRIEAELGFKPNPGRDTPWTGSDRSIQRQRADKSLPPRITHRRHELMPHSDGEETEIFVRQIMRRLQKSQQAGQRAAAAAQRQAQFQARGEAIRKHQAEAERRRQQTLARERAAMSKQQTAHRKGEK